MQHVNVVSYQLWPKEVRPEDQGPVVSAGNWDWPMLCQLWIMDDREPVVWQVIIHSLGVQHPSLDTSKPAKKRWGWVRIKWHSLGAHILRVHPVSFFTPSSFKKQGSHWLSGCHGKPAIIKMKYEVPQTGAFLRCRAKQSPICRGWGAEINCCFVKHGSAPAHSLDIESRTMPPCAWGLRYVRQIAVFEVPQQ